MAAPARSLVAVVIQQVIVAFLWGGTYVAGRIVAQALAPVEGAALRFLWAGLGIVLLLSWNSGWRSVGWRDAILLVLMGLTGIAAYNLFFFAGLQTVSASRGSLIVSLNPVGIMLGARLVLGEKLPARKVTGIILSLLGAIVVVASRPDVGVSSSHRGELLMFGCVLCWTMYTLFARKVLARVPSLTASGYSTLAGMIILAVVAAPHASGGKLAAISWQVWTALAFLGLLATALAFKWYMDGVVVLGTSRAAQFINLVPVFAVVLSMLILGERPSLRCLVGGGLVITGLLITQAI